MSDSRKYTPLSEAQAPFFVGIDVGGTSIKFGVVDDLGQTLARYSIPTEVEKGPESACERMGPALEHVVAEAGLTKDQIARVGLGSAGPMDVRAGKLMLTANLPGWNHFPIRDRTAHHTGLPVTFVNDADAAALGEYWVGSAREADSLVLLTLGTGIGCGIVIDGINLIGANSCGGEAGHIIIDYAEDARVCGCGKTGHLEAYASATAVKKIMQEHLDAGRESSLTARIAAGESLTPKMIAEEAEQEDPLCEEVVLSTARFLGVGIASIMHTVDPELILLGGAMTFGQKKTTIGRRFLQEVLDEIRRRAVSVLPERVKIDFASLGGAAGYLGAAAVARKEHATVTR
ncbi:MAG: ROK family protein [Planctomycetia bacterium]|jgi:glucokinase